MEELTIEEKAKRYDEAIERANELNYVSDKDSLQCKTVEHIFPELKESEDENIRKFLINEVLGHLGMLDLEGDRIVNNVKNDLWKKALSWLEKQGNTNKIITRNEFTHGVLRGAAINLINWIDSNAAKNNMCLSNMECKDIEDALVSCNWDKIYAYMKKKFEKQGEKSQGKSALETINEEKINNQNCVKPADKIEPKFKVGDWVVQENIGVYKVIEVCESWYEVVDNKDKHYSIGFDKEYMCHLWTIQDAKAGDVLVDQNGEMPFIFKECKNNHVYCYCGYTNRKDIFFDKFVDSENEELHWLNLYHEQAYPAAKEQRDTLMKAMADAGYTFDFEKKELKKIEQKPTNLAKGEDYGIDGLYNAIRILEKTLGKVDGYQTDDGILEHECAISAVKKLYEQKSAWSEEDEEMVQVAINACNSYQDSLVRSDSRFDKAVKAEDWLKDLKDRVQPQPKQEWSKEDEKDFNTAIQHIENYVNNTPSSQRPEIWADITKLKDLKDRYTKKSVEDHYELEEFAKIVRGNLTGISKAVQELFKAKYLQLTGNKMYGGFKD